MTSQTQPDFYQQIEDFILCAVADNSTEDHATNTEVALFLLTLLSSYKKEELTQAKKPDKSPYQAFSLVLVR